MQRHHPQAAHKLAGAFFLCSAMLPCSNSRFKAVFLDCTAHFVSLHVPLGHVPNDPSKTEITRFMVSLIAGQFLQHHGSPFYPLYTHSEAYTGDEDSTVHGCNTIVLVNPPTRAPLYIGIKTPCCNRNGTARLSNT
jgi:hypothetical protein